MSSVFAGITGGAQWSICPKFGNLLPGEPEQAFIENFHKKSFIP
jgi:hypothetical protein